MKNKPMYFQIWFMTTAVVTVISIASACIMYVWTDRYFEKEMKNEVEVMQASLIRRAEETASEDSVGMVKYDVSIDELKFDEDNVQSGFFSLNEAKLNEDIPDAELTKAEKVELKIIDKATETVPDSVIYADTIEGKPVTVAIKSVFTPSGEGYAYTVAYNRYKSMLNELAALVAGAVVLFLLVSFIVMRMLCKRMTRGITTLSQYADRIAYHNWNEPVAIEGSAEISGLASSFEHMRGELVRRDDEMQSMLRYISHELKTPIMVIRSYIDAAKDNIYPKGSLESTLNIMEGQALRLQEKVKDLLYITRLEGCKQHHEQWSDHDLSSILEDVTDNIEMTNRDIRVVRNIQEDVSIACDENHMTVLFENMADNVLRHAMSTASVSMTRDGGIIRISFYNDGQPVEPELREKIFMPFEKGKNGNVGLGLCICSKIVDIYGGSIQIPYLERGCMFIIELPLKECPDEQS